MVTCAINTTDDRRQTIEVAFFGWTMFGNERASLQNDNRRKMYSLFFQDFYWAHLGRWSVRRGRRGCTLGLLRISFEVGTVGTSIELLKCEV